MVNRAIAIPLLLGAIALEPGLSAPAPPPKQDVAVFAQSSNAFGFELYRHLRQRPGNLVFSPASVSMALAMTWGGARGQTAAEMQRVLRYPGTSTEMARVSGKLSAMLQDPARPIVFRIANRLFGERSFSFEPAFIEATRLAYGAPLEPVDFRGAPEAARGKINGWVESVTEKRISELIPEGGLSATSSLVLVNAIYFLGAWEMPFVKGSTLPRPFHLTTSTQKNVATMHRTSTLRYGRREGLQAVELPYKGESMSLLVLLPDAIEGLAGVERTLTASGLDRIVAALAPAEVALALPKFEVNPAASTPLGPTLAAMGMPSAFSSSADFSGIAKAPLRISEAFHKAFVKIDEKETVAAAATAIVMVPTMGPPHPKPNPTPIVFNADHPFLFFIRDQATGLVLFMGRVTDPS